MKSVSLKLAIAGALSLAGVSAMALPPSAIDNTVVRVYIGGATATDNAFENLAKVITTNNLCAPGTLDIYYRRSAGNGSAVGAANNRVFFCTAGFTNNASSIPLAERITAGTTKIAIFKHSIGGSATGISPVARGTAAQFIDFFSGASNVATACAAISSSVPASSDGNLAAYNTRDCGATVSAASTVTLTAASGSPDGISVIAPNVGVSDVDPESFVGSGGVTAADAAALTRKRASIGVLFNPIVSVPMFRALQDAQGLIASGAAEDTTSIDNIPTLSSAVLRGIFSGTILDGDHVYTNGVQLSAKLPGSDKNIYVCRRGDTSGTMTSFKFQYLDQGCAKNSGSIAKFVSPDVAATESGGTTWAASHGAEFVFAGSSNGEVQACVDYHSSQGQFAIGTSSTEAKPNTTTARFRYVRVDGAEPTLKAAQEGRYDFFTENTMNDKYTATVSSGAQAIFDQAFTLISNKVVIAKVNEGWRDAAQIGVTVDATHGIGEGDVGILDIPASGNAPTFPVTAAQARTNAVNGQRRSAPGSSSANNCNRPIMVAPF